MAGFRSFESFRQMNFLGMEFWNSYSRDFITDRELLVIASDVTSYPRLSARTFCFAKTSHATGKANSFASWTTLTVDKCICSYGQAR